MRKLAVEGFVRHGHRNVVGEGHGNVDVLKNLARCDADDAVGRFDKVIALASGMLAAEMVDEAKSGTELLGFDQEASAVRLPIPWFHVARTRERKLLYELVACPTAHAGWASAEFLCASERECTAQNGLGQFSIFGAIEENSGLGFSRIGTDEAKPEEGEVEMRDTGSFRAAGGAQ